MVFRNQASRKISLSASHPCALRPQARQGHVRSRYAEDVRHSRQPVGLLVRRCGARTQVLLPLLLPVAPAASRDASGDTCPASNCMAVEPERAEVLRFTDLHPDPGDGVRLPWLRMMSEVAGVAWQVALPVAERLFREQHIRLEDTEPEIGRRGHNGIRSAWHDH